MRGISKKLRMGNLIRESGAQLFWLYRVHPRVVYVLQRHAMKTGTESVQARTANINWDTLSRKDT